MSRLGEPLDSTLAEHVKGCLSCQETLSTHEGLGKAGVAASASALWPAVAKRASAELARKPKASRWWFSALALSALNVLVAGLASFSFHRLGLNGNPTPTPVRWPLAGVLLGLLFAGPLFALAPRRRSSLLALVLIALSAGAGVVWLGSGTGPSEPLSTGMGCLISEVGLSLLPVGFGLWILSGSAFHPLRALSLSLCCATAGLLALDLHCPDGRAAHLFLFHVGPWILVGALAFLLRARLPSRTFAP
jgi:hypothetical protein